MAGSPKARVVGEKGRQSLSPVCLPKIPTPASAVTLKETSTMQNLPGIKGECKAGSPLLSTGGLTASPSLLHPLLPSSVHTFVLRNKALANADLHQIS